MKCPVDADVDLVMSDRQGVEIDYCPRCRGVWLDRGELDKILERSARETAPPAPPQQQQHQGRPYDPRQDPYYDRKRKKSFLQELFD